jgi:hypothetical protein
MTTAASEPIDLQTLFRLAAIDTWEEEQAMLAGTRCGRCGQPIPAGILALHRHCPAIPPALERALRGMTCTRQNRKRGHRAHRLISRQKQTPSPATTHRG